jgi:ABC-type nitrate/sulfonate/bicarbonate transport system substrate-binding protein
MREDERLALAAAFIDHFSTPYVWDKDLVLTKRDTAATEWASSKVIDLALEHPEELWDFILEVLKRDPPDEVIEVLAAGPLEDYIAKLGDSVIERVEQQAASDPKFRSLLGGVWRNNISDDVWRRVQACSDRSGWDGNV